MSKVKHTLKPVYDKNSKTLILGSMPSVKSREIMKYYGHPQNRFWHILEIIYEEDSTEWQNFILKHNLALWDVIASCDIDKSSDSSIKNVEVNKIDELIKNSSITNIVVLGKTAYNLYQKYVYPITNIEGIYLPSPSSANASKSLEELVEEYKIIKKVTNEK